MKFSPHSSYVISQAQPFALIPPSSLVFARSTIPSFTQLVFSDTYTSHSCQCHHHPQVSSPYPCSPQKGRPHKTTARIQWQRTDNSKGKILFRKGLLWIEVNTQNNELFRVWCKNPTEYGMFTLTGCSFYRATSSWSLGLHVRRGTGHQVGSQQLGTQWWEQRFILITTATDCLLSVCASEQWQCDCRARMTTGRPAPLTAWIESLTRK
jgi:hypothetical protein